MPGAGSGAAHHPNSRGLPARRRGSHRGTGALKSSGGNWCSCWQQMRARGPEKNLNSCLLPAGHRQKRQSGCLRQGARKFSWCCREAGATSSPNRTKYLNANGVNHRPEQFSLFTPRILLPAAGVAITPRPLLLSPLRGFEQKPVAKFSLPACAVPARVNAWAPLNVAFAAAISRSWPPTPPHTEERCSLGLCVPRRGSRMALDPRGRCLQLLAAIPASRAASPRPGAHRHRVHPEEERRKRASAASGLPNSAFN